MENNTKTRIEWIDICKAIAIFSMVFCHVWLELPKSCKMLEPAPMLDHFIHYWHMPIFFILSGLVFNPAKYGGWSNFRNLVKSRARMLLVPFLIFGIVCGAYNYLMFFPNKELSLINITKGILIPNHNLFLFSFQWFLLSLFCTEIVFATLWNLAGGKRSLCALLSVSWLGGGILLLKHISFDLPLSLDTTFFMVPLFAIGVLGKDFFLRKRPLRNRWAQLAVGALLILLFFFPLGKTNIRCCLYNPWWSYPLGIAVTVLVILLIREQEGWITKLKIYPAIKWMGQTSLAILMLNGSIRKSIPLKWLSTDSGAVVFAIQMLDSILIVAIIYVIARLIKKYVPFKLI